MVETLKSPPQGPSCLDACLRLSVEEKTAALQIVRSLEKHDREGLQFAVEQFSKNPAVFDRVFKAVLADSVFKSLKMATFVWDFNMRENSGQLTVEFSNCRYFRITLPEPKKTHLKHFFESVLYCYREQQVASLISRWQSLLIRS